MPKVNISALVQLLVDVRESQLTPEEILNELITVLFDGDSPKPADYEGKPICHDDEAFLDVPKSELRKHVSGLSEPIANLLWEDEKLRGPLQMILYEIQHYPNLN